MRQKLLFSLTACIVGILLIVTYQISRRQQTNQDMQETSVDLPQIIERGELVVLTINSPTSFFNYRGENMGFQYELAQVFCHSLGIKLKIQAVNGEDELVRQLLAGKGDLIAYNLSVTKSRKDSLLFCGNERISHQVIVQRRDKNVLKDVTQLIDKDIYVLPGVYSERLENLNDELGGGVRIHKITNDSLVSEDLMNWVAEGKIDYTVSTNELAKVSRTYNPNLNIALKISFDQRSSWAVKKTSPLLAEAIDKWFDENGETSLVQSINQRYFGTDKHTSHGTILSLADGKISHFDDYFRQYAKEINWDWRLLASLAYSESNFDPTVVSWAGAKGLMQLMPATAHAYGVPAGKESDPEESIKAGVKYIAALQKIFKKVTDRNEQTKFVLAAYNSGAGHVLDAMALTKKYGGNYLLWDNQVEKYLLLKSHKQYYQDPVCKNGYFRGQETYRFVRAVTDRAKMYQLKIKEK